MSQEPFRVRRVEPVDTLRLDDGALVLHERTVIRLNELGLAITDLCNRPRTIGELAEELTHAFGEPPQGGLAATRDAVDALLSVGVIREEATPDDSRHPALPDRTES